MVWGRAGCWEAFLLAVWSSGLQGDGWAKVCGQETGARMEVGKRKRQGEHNKPRKSCAREQKAECCHRV